MENNQIRDLLTVITQFLKGDTKSTQEYINQQQQRNGHCINLMIIIDNQELDIQTRQFAASNLKNTIDQYWRARKDNFVISEEDKGLVRGSLLEAMIRAVQSKELTKIYQSIIHAVAVFDYPVHWASLTDEITNKINKSQDFNELFASLLSLHSLIKIYEFQLSEDRIPLDQIIAKTFPGLQILALKLLENYNEQTAKLVKPLLKIFHASIHMTMPKLMLETSILDNWMRFLKLLIDSKVPPELHQYPSNQNERDFIEQHVMWLVKKWGGKIMFRFIQRYANENLNREPHMKGFSKFWLEKYSVGFLESYLKVVIDSKAVFIPRSHIHFSLKYIFYSYKKSHLETVLKPHSQSLLIDYLLPLICLNEKDMDLWKTDPEEFIRQNEDNSLLITDNKNLAIQMILQIVRKSKPLLIGLMNYCSACLHANADPRNQAAITPTFKQGILLCFSRLDEVVLKDHEVKQNIEVILEKYIMPEFDNTFAPIRARAAECFGKYGNIEFKNQNNIQTAVLGICKCLQDNNLPIRVSAAIALNCIVDQEEARAIVLPELSMILTIFIKLMDIIDNQGLVKALEGIIDTFADKISPFAVDLCMHLSTSFFKYNNKNENENENDDDDDQGMGEGQLAASGCLEAISKIMKSNLSPESYLRIEEQVRPIINFCLSEDMGAYMEEILSIINLIVYKSPQISQNMWFLYPVLVYMIQGIPDREKIDIAKIPNLDEEQLKLLDSALEGWGMEFASISIGILSNYIQKGQREFFQYRDFITNVTFCELLFQMIDQVYFVGGNGESDVDVLSVTRLYITIMENFKGAINEVVLAILEKCMVRLFNSEIKLTQQVKALNVEVIAIAFWYDPLLTFEYMENKKATEDYFKVWFDLKGKFVNDFQMQRIMIGFSSILTLHESQIPSAILPRLDFIFKYLVQLSGEIVEAREQESTIQDDEDIDYDDDTEYKKTLEKLDQFNNNKNQNVQNDDEEDDDDEDFDENDIIDGNCKYDSPFEEFDEIIRFETILAEMSQVNPNFYGQLINCLTEQEQVSFTASVNKSKEQWADYLQSKQESNQ